MTNTRDLAVLEHDVADRRQTEGAGENLPGVYPRRRKPIRWAYHYACRFLAANGPQPADMVGNAVWKGKKRGKTSSMGGGGDFGAQMLLGRMRKAGLVRVRNAKGDGCSIWELTAAGLKESRR